MGAGLMATAGVDFAGALGVGQTKFVVVVSSVVVVLDVVAGGVGCAGCPLLELDALKLSVCDRGCGYLDLWHDGDCDLRQGDLNQDLALPFSLFCTGLPHCELLEWVGDELPSLAHFCRQSCSLCPALFLRR